jgi:lipopolysaccharide transport system permease protein
VAIEERSGSNVRGRGAVAAVAASDKPLLEVVGGRGRLSAESLRELWVFRGVLWAFVVRQIKVRYKQAAIGVGWAVLQPVLAAAIFALFLGKLAGVASEGVPYLLFAIAGLAPWTFFSAATGTASDSLVANGHLIRKIYFPREVLPFSAIGAAALDLVCALATLAVAAGLYGIAPSLPWLAIPLPILTLALFAAAVGTALCAVNVYYRDVRYALPFLLQLLLFATPVVYSLSVVPSGWRTAYAIANPAAASIDSTRRIFVHQEWPQFLPLLCALGLSAALLLLAYAFFKRLERGFSDRM